MTAPLVVFVTDPAHSLIETIAAIRAAGHALGAGRLLVQVRDKRASEDSLLASARALRDVTRESGTLLVINGSPAVAASVGADGVHFPNEGEALATQAASVRASLGATAIVTTSAHDDEDVRHAVRAGATAVLVSPIFATPGKGAPRGVEALVAARAVVDAARHTPRVGIYALGGVTRENAASCAAAGADGVAAIRAVYEGHALALAKPFARANA